MKCHFCTAEATHTCTFKQPDPRIVFPHEIQPLDFVRDDVTLRYFAVKKITVNGENYAVLKLSGDKRVVIARYVNVRLPCLRMEIHPCGNRTCENHIREFDEDLLQCAEHWEGFEKVYGVD